MISNDNERREFYGSEVFAPDSLIRDWATIVASTWSALEPADPDQTPADTRTEKSFGAALAIIKDFRLRQDLGEPQSVETLRWLSEALGRVLDHKDPLHSLGLMPLPNNRPPDPQLAEDVALWIQCARRRNYDDAEAVSLAADTFAKDTKTISRYLARAVGWAAVEPSNEAACERYFEIRRRPLPPHRDKK